MKIFLFDSLDEVGVRVETISDVNKILAIIKDISIHPELKYMIFIDKNYLDIRNLFHNDISASGHDHVTLKEEVLEYLATGHFKGNGLVDLTNLDLYYGSMEPMSWSVAESIIGEIGYQAIVATFANAAKFQRVDGKWTYVYKSITPNSFLDAYAVEAHGMSDILNFLLSKDHEGVVMSDYPLTKDLYDRLLGYINKL